MSICIGTVRDLWSEFLGEVLALLAESAWFHCIDLCCLVFVFTSGHLVLG